MIGALLASSLLIAACASGDGELVSSEAVGAGRAEADDPELDVASSTTPVPRGGRQPDADDPLRVLFTGDSIGAELAAPAVVALGEGGAAIAEFVASPAIPRDPVRRNLWETRLSISHPEVVVVLVGVWERMGFREAALEGQTLAQYRSEVIDPFIELVTSRGAALIWVSAPSVEDRTASGQLRFLDEAYRGVGEGDARVEYIDAAASVANPDGDFIEIVTSPEGFAERVRRVDGTHLCPGGAVLMAEPVIDFVADRWNIPVDGDWRNGDWRHTEPFENSADECPAVG